MYRKINGVLEKISDEEISGIAKQQSEYEKTDEYKQGRMLELKQQLSDTDYIPCKIAEGSATKEEYAEMIAKRVLWREEINKLEAEIK